MHARPHRRIRTAICLAAAIVGWTVPTSRSFAQESSSGTSAPLILPRGFSLFIGTGWSTIDGAAVRRATSHGGGFGGGLMGVGYEQPFTKRLTFRVEGGISEPLANVGELSLAGSANTLHTQRTSLGGSVRRYGRAGHFIGLGANVTHDNWCFVQQRAKGASRSETLDCPVFSAPTVTAEGSSLEASFSAGIDRRRFAFEARYDQGVTPVVRIDNDPLRSRSVNAVVQLRVGNVDGESGRRTRAIAPPPGQLQAGMVGWGIGALGGLLIGAATAQEGGDWSPLLGALGGSAVGTTTALHLFGRKHGLQSNVFRTFGGTLLGLVGGPAIPFTMPLGGMMGYNSASRERK